MNQQWIYIWTLGTKKWFLLGNQDLRKELNLVFTLVAASGDGAARANRRWVLLCRPSRWTIDAGPEDGRRIEGQVT